MIQGEIPTEMLIITKGVCELVYRRCAKPMDYLLKRAHVDKQLKNMSFGKKGDPERTNAFKQCIQPRARPESL